MKLLEKLAFGLGITSGIVNAYVAGARLMDTSPDLPSLTWGLHLGVFVCFLPALYQRTTRVTSDLESESFVEQARKGGQLAWEGISKWPLVLLWAYGMVCFVLEGGSSEPWLAFSVVWIAFYYISWAILTDENRKRAAA